MSRTVKIIIAAILVAVLGVGAYFLISSEIRRSKHIMTSEFIEAVVNKQFSEIQVDGYTLTGYFRDSKDYRWAIVKDYYGADGVVGEDGLVKDDLERWKDAGYIDKYDKANPSSGSGWTTALYVVVLAIGLLAFFMVLRATSSGGGKAMSFGRTKARVSTNLKVRFSDVAGAEEEKEELQEVVEFLKNPKKFSSLGAKIPKGVLLVGPPGTGKTLFAKAVAGEANVPFFSVSGSDFVEMYVGVGASRVRDLFDLAKRNQPCIIFIDEIDAVGRQRGAGLGGGHDEREQTLNQILVQMDGFETNEGVIVMAATNRADILDSALLRPGRFDRQIYVNLPDVRGREQILKVHARNKPMSPEVNFKVIARITSGFSGADLANLLNEAAILAAREGKSMIGNHDLYEGINKVIMGPQKKSRVVSELDKKNTAYHESGHAILAKLCKNCEEVQEVSIIPRGMAAGYTLTRPETDDRRDTVNKLNDDICMTLGGRVAEEIVVHDVSAGASNDIQVATKEARRMVTEWGMSDRLGPIAYGSSGPVFLGRDYEERNIYSEETAGIIDEEVKKIIMAQYERARKLLTEHRSVLDNMARVLVERETIYTDEVDMLMEGKDYKEVLAYMEVHDSGAPDAPFGRKFEKTPAGKAVENLRHEEGEEGSETPAKPQNKPVEAQKPDSKEVPQAEKEEKRERSEKDENEKED